MKLGSIALAAAVALAPAAGMAAAAPNRPAAPAAAPAVSQFDQGVAAYGRADYATAYRLWRPLADQGLANAQYNLGLMYANGQGVAQDYVQAHNWFNLGAVSGHASAVKNRDSVAAKMTPAQIAEAQRLASAWKPK